MLYDVLLKSRFSHRYECLVWRMGMPLYASAYKYMYKHVVHVHLHAHVHDCVHYAEIVGVVE